MTLAYTMSFAGVPFALDKAKVFRLGTKSNIQQGDSGGPPSPQQEDVDLYDELNKKIPFDRLDDVQSMSPYPGRGLLGLGLQAPACKNPYTNVKIGEWYYPTSASRWSIFRGLATSTMVKQMLASTAGNIPRTFIMKSTPDNLSGAVESNYALSTSMYMLPPRPLAEMGGKFDGLYLVTLVDERYYWQDTPLTLNVNWTSTWASVLTQVGVALGISISTASAIETVYSSPEPDSSLWLSNESSAIVLDCIAANIGRTLVRNLNGSYTLYTPSESRTLVASNRTLTKTVRTAGGDLFQTGTTLPVGSLSDARNSVVPTSVSVSFPKYVTGNDPVPHFMNSRYGSQRPTSWNEDAYSDVYTVTVPILSGGSLVAGLTGTSTTALRDTAKAFYPTEATSTPTNASGLTSLAMRIARDLYENQVAAALDEIFPGTFAWTPEGLHDLIWTYSAKAGGAFLRVLRTTWNSLVRDFQHAPHALLGYTQVPVGEGGHSVAQTHRDAVNTAGQTTLSFTLLSGFNSLNLVDGASLPQDTRWKAQIENEILLCEGVSGGTLCYAVVRGIDNTLESEHPAGATVSQIVPNTTYGINLVEYGPGFRVSPGKWTSGGVRGVEVDYDIFASGNFASGEIQSGYIVNDGSTIVNNFITNYLNSGSVQNFGSGVAASGYSGYQIIFNQFLNLFWNVVSGRTLTIGGSGVINIVGFGGGASRYEQYFNNEFHPTTSGGGTTSGFVSMAGHPRIGRGSSVTKVMGSGVCYALPFINGRSGAILNELVANLGGGAASGNKAVLGVYTNYTATNPKPDELVIDIEVDCSGTGMKYGSVAGTQLSNDLYWLVLQAKFGTSAFMGLHAEMAPMPILGVDMASTEAAYGYFANEPYLSALPGNFASGPNTITAAGTTPFAPAIGVTFLT